MTAEDRSRHTDRVRAVFDDWADTGRAEGMETGHGFAARRAFDRLDLRPGERYLDLGCGNGYTVCWADDVVGPEGRAAGLDLSSRMVERAVSRSGPDATFHQAAFPDHPFAPATFDAVFSMEVLYYLPDLDRAVRAVHDLLAPGGRFVCVVDFYAENEASHGWPADLGCAMVLLDVAGWRRAFDGAGLDVPLQERIRHPLDEGDQPTWQQTEGSLLTLGVRPA